MYCYLSLFVQICSFHNPHIHVEGASHVVYHGLHDEDSRSSTWTNKKMLVVCTPQQVDAKDATMHKLESVLSEYFSSKRGGWYTVKYTHSTMLSSPGERQAVLLAVFVLQARGVISQFGTWYATRNENSEKMSHKRLSYHLPCTFTMFICWHVICLSS